MRRKKAREIEDTRETQIIISNFLKIGNDWAIVAKYAKTVVYVGTHFFSAIPGKL